MKPFHPWRLGGTALALVLGWHFSGTAGETANTQLYQNARYALIGTEIDVSLQQGSGADFRRRVIVRIDTQTGTTSVLQLAQLGVTNPTVSSAVWAPVSETGNFLNENNLTITETMSPFAFFYQPGSRLEYRPVKRLETTVREE